MFVNFIVNYLFSFGGTERITRQGFPTANTLAGMFLVTTLPAPIVVLSPILTPGKRTT